MRRGAPASLNEQVINLTTPESSLQASDITDRDPLPLYLCAAGLAPVQLLPVDRSSSAALFVVEAMFHLAVWRQHMPCPCIRLMES